MENGAWAFGLSFAPSNLFLRFEGNIITLQVFGQSGYWWADWKKPKQTFASFAAVNHSNQEGAFDQGFWDRLHDFEKDSKVGIVWRNDWLSIGSLLQTNSSSFQHV